MAYAGKWIPRLPIDLGPHFRLQTHAEMEAAGTTRRKLVLIREPLVLEGDGPLVLELERALALELGGAPASAPVPARVQPGEIRALPIREDRRDIDIQGRPRKSSPASRYCQCAHDRVVRAYRSGELTARWAGGRLVVFPEELDRWMATWKPR